MIEGKKIYLSSVSKDSIEAFRLWRNDPNLRKYFREYREISDLMQEKWYKRINETDKQVDFEIRTQNSDKLIGHCGLYYISWTNRVAEFGIYIGDHGYRSGGFGSDALRTLIEYGFNQLNLNRIWCEVYSNNNALDIYKHIGFVEEGLLRQSYYDDGVYWDSHILGLLKEDWKTNEQ